VEYWHSKLDRNVRRDKRVIASLRARGWRVAVVWECETKEPANLRRKLAGLLKRAPARNTTRGKRRANNGMQRTALRAAADAER
jgi:DNA mismatch endonuclease (patch repair protein)